MLKENQTLIPIPDPTLLTTQQLIREIGSLREVMDERQIKYEQRMAGMDNALASANAAVKEALTSANATTRDALAAAYAATRDALSTANTNVDKAITPVKEAIDNFPLRLHEKLSSFAEIQNEKFRSIGVQFSERDTRTDQTSRDSKVAVDAALQAAKEAVAEQNRSSALAISKSEAATVKQIDQQGIMITTGTKAMDDKIDDIKERLTRIEGKDAGATANSATRQSTGNSAVNLIGLILGTLIGAVGIAIAFFHK